jgi:hypothetical protein
VTVLVGSCVDFGEKGPSYWPFIESLRSLARLNPKAVDRVVKPLQAQLWTVPPDVPDPASSLATAADPAGIGPTPMFEFFLQVLTGLAEASPVLLVVEDLHWSERQPGSGDVTGDLPQ